MPQPPDHDALTLAGLAAANGPWLSTRLSRLAELAGLSLPPDVIRLAVESSSRLLTEVLTAGGRPAMLADEAADPVARMGRAQAVAHQQAGLSMPVSLAVQRLLRRSYDDLVRESWVDKDSRSRAHEDVERFFERALVGLVTAWTGHASRREAELCGLVDRRGEQLRRALAAAKKCMAALRRERGLRQDLAGRLARAASEIRALRDSQGQSSGQSSDQPSGQPSGQSSLSPTPFTPAGGSPSSSPAPTSAAETNLRAELRALREAHASLASEAEAMRARLSEAGSRVSELRRARERDVERELADAEAELGRVRARLAEVEALRAEERAHARADRAVAAERSAVLESEISAERERRAMERERLEAERERLKTELAALTVECDGLAAEGGRLAVERAARVESQVAARREIAGCVEELSRAQVELLNVRAELAALKASDVGGGTGGGD